MNNYKAWLDQRVKWLEVQCKAHWGRDWQEFYGVAYEAAIRLAKAFDPRKCNCLPEMYVGRLLAFRVRDIMGRRRAAHKCREPVLTASVENWVSPVATAAMIAASADAFERLLHGLDPQQKCMTRMYCGGLTMREVGKAMGVSESAMSQRFATVKELVKRDLLDGTMRTKAGVGDPLPS